jgi:plasmid stabilization system protein ParE
VILLSPEVVSDIERLRTFIGERNPFAAIRAPTEIWTAIERLQEFPDLGMPTDEPDIRQMIIRFGSSGYIVRYASLPERGDFHHSLVAWTRVPVMTFCAQAQIIK